MASRHKEADKGRRFVFTWHDYDEETIDIIKEINARYVIVGYEESSAGRLKWLQCFALFDNCKSIRQLRSLMPEAYVSYATGSTQACIRFCERRGDYREFGTRPKGIMSEVRGGERKKRKENTEDDDTDIDSDSTVSYEKEEKLRLIMNVLIDNGYDAVDLYERNNRLYLDNVDFVRNLCEMEKKIRCRKNVRSCKTVVHVFSGRPGSGKTRYALKAIAKLGTDYYCKDSTHWWTGYQQEEIVFMDDFNESWMDPDSLIRLMSQLPCYVPKRGKDVTFACKHLFITSSVDPYSWYNKCEGFQIRALMDRIDEWIVFDKCADGGYHRTTMREYRDEKRKFETMSQLEDASDEDQHDICTN